jgi:hypothetical protein
MIQMNKVTPHGALSPPLDRNLGVVKCVPLTKDLVSNYLVLVPAKPLPSVLDSTTSFVPNPFLLLPQSINALTKLEDHPSPQFSV